MKLKKTELEKYRKKLLALREHVEHNLQETTDEVKQTDESQGYSQHQADEGTDDFGKVISLELSHAEQELLKQIDRAIEKIEEGTYGICDVSGKVIPKDRLDAIPYATMTVVAQEQHEKGLI